MMYKQAYHEYPASLQDIAPLTSPVTFHCPGDNERVIGDISKVDDWSSFVYLPKNFKIKAPPSSIIIAYCKPENHKNRFLNVLFADGKVKSYTNINVDLLKKNP